MKKRYRLIYMRDFNVWACCEIGGRGTQLWIGTIKSSIIWTTKN